MPALPFDQAVADVILERIADGQSLRTICKDPSLPAMSTVFKWLADKENPSFAEQYAHAREAQADTFADEIVTIADEGDTRTLTGDDGVIVVFDPTAVARNRLRVDARKWVAAKLRPKKYGEKLELAGDPAAPLTVQLVRFSE